MAEFDYAFLADYAKFEATGTLTAVGISFTQLRVPSIPAIHILSVAGRIRCRIDEKPLLKISINSQNKSTEITGEMHAENIGKLIPYDKDKVGLLFAANIPTPITESGVYEVHIQVDGIEVRCLKFEVSN